LRWQNPLREVINKKVKEKLIIKNFGPIKDVELELGSFNVLIGDQGTGKSTVSKLYSLIYNYAYYDIFNDVSIESSHDPNTLKFFRNLEWFGIINYLDKDTDIKLYTSRFQFEFAGGVVKSEHPELYKTELSKMPEWINDHFKFNYIIAERVYVSTLADALFGLNELGTKLPTLFNRFGNKFSSVRKEKAKRDYKELLGADFSHINGVDTVILKNGKILPLSDTSTGMQGTMPMLVVFDSVVEKITSDGNSNPNGLLVIEEPELNLFPETQKKILEYIVSKNLDDGSFKIRLIINTHSPYILTSLNNLMYAFEVGANKPEEVTKIIDKKYWINPEDVRVYRLMLDGTAKKIISKTEDGTLIDAEEIDEVSSIINKEFNSLINIELGVENEED
jgi:predicted ATPase